jgi:hypothetical protein
MPGAEYGEDVVGIGCVDLDLRPQSPHHKVYSPAQHALCISSDLL